MNPTSINTVTMKYPKILLLLGASAIVVGASAQILPSETLLADSFEIGVDSYSVGALQSQNPTSMTPSASENFGAYGAAWGGQNFPEFGDPQVVSQGLSYPGLLSSGGSVMMERVQGASAILKTASISLQGVPAGGEGDSVYFSGLLQLGGADYARLGIRIGGSASKDVISVGVNAAGNAQIWAEGNVESQSVGTFDVSGTVFVVGEILRDSGSNTAFLYVNPSLSGKPATATISADIGTRGWFPSDALSVLQMNAFLNPQGEATYFDEIRIGESWESVVVIPEPSVYAAFFGLLALGWVFARRRRGA